MPTYLYFDGRHEWDVMKPLAALDQPEACPKCGEPGQRQLCAPSIDRLAAGSWNTQTFNPALGCYTRSDQHARKIAKARGLEEVGTEPPDRIWDHFEKQRAEKRERVWAEADREKQFGD